MITFKPIRYRHKLEQQEIWAKIEAGEMTYEDDHKWVMAMVAAWDLTDEETGEPIPAGQFLDLSLIQDAAVLAAWDAYAAATRAEVKKTRESP